jgi:S-adenosylmethionine synthetase
MNAADRLEAGEVGECAEWVLPGHPDKLCDAAADNVVAFITRSGANSQCGVELVCIFDRVVITGRVASNDKYAVAALRDYQVHNMIRDAYASAGYGEDAAGHVWGPRPEDLKIDVYANIGLFDDGEAELRHLSDDQAICVGYANSITECDGLPPAHWLAGRIARTLFDLRRKKCAGQVGPDGKVLARIARKGRAWRPLSVSISLHHHEASDWVFLNAFAEEAVETACAGRATPGITLNGGGMFVCGGPNGDNGQTGKKLVMDAYGPSVPIGGGAWSGKDFWKVDRRGGLLARAMARRLVDEHGCDEARVTLEYYPGSDAPAHGEAIVDGRRVMLDCRALTAASVVPKLQAIFTPPKSSGREIALKEAARWGHHACFGALGRELPDFVPSSSVMRSRIRDGARPREDRAAHLVD